MECPFCKEYGLTVDLEEFERNGVKHYRCQNKDMPHEFCEHVLNATKKDLSNFDCSDCDSPINECNCFDCYLYCQKCNEFIWSISCSELASVIIMKEEEKK